MATLKDVCPFLLFICTALQECSHGRSRHRGGQEAGGGGTLQLHMTQHMTPSQAGARRLTLPVTCYLNNAAQGIEGTHTPRIQYATRRATTRPPQQDFQTTTGYTQATTLVLLQPQLGRVSCQQPTSLRVKLSS
jgi:hypothetical protein